MTSNKNSITLAKDSAYEFVCAFYRASGIPISISDPVRIQDVSSPRDSDNLCGFCKNRCPEFSDRCKDNEKTYTSECLATQKTVVYRCHCGLTEAIIPISTMKKTIGTVFLGQVLIDNQNNVDDISAHLTEKYPHKFSREDKALISQAYANTTAMSRERFEAYISMVSMFAQSLNVAHWLDTRIITSKMIFNHYIESTDFVRMPLSEVDTKKIAEELSISYSQLNRMSTTILNMPIKQFILRRKIDTAKQILISKPDMRIKDVGSAVGIADNHYFSRLFHKYTGLTCEEVRLSQHN